MQRQGTASFEQIHLENRNHRRYLALMRVALTCRPIDRPITCVSRYNDTSVASVAQGSSPGSSPGEDHLLSFLVWSALARNVAQSPVTSRRIRGARAIESHRGPVGRSHLTRRDAARGRRIDWRDWCNLACARVESVLRSSGRLTRHQGLALDDDFGPVALACLADAPLPYPTVPTRLASPRP